MDNLQVKIVKTDNGFKATTDYKMADVADGSRVLRITTRKRLFCKGEVMTQATVHTAKPTGEGYIAETHAMGMGSGLGDFSMTVERVACSRVTEKTVVEMHKKNLAGFADILARAVSHYERQVANVA
jgi:hypothetical protein